MERCRREIAAVELLIRAGHPDLQGLCLALADWSAELRLLQASRGLATGRARLAHVRSCGGSLTWGPTRQESRPDAEKPAAAVPGGPVEGGRGYFGNR